MMQRLPVRTAWLLLVAALALHVIDEATTGFLNVYNPTVRALRNWLGWFPMPTFDFGEWLGGLIAVIVVIALATPLIERSRIARRVGLVFAGLMIMNGVGHHWDARRPNGQLGPLPAPDAWLLVVAVPDRGSRAHIWRVTAEHRAPLTGAAPSSK